MASRWHHSPGREIQEASKFKEWGEFNLGHKEFKEHIESTRIVKGLHLRGPVKEVVVRIVGTMEEKRNDHFVLERLLWFQPGRHSDPVLSWKGSEEQVAVKMESTLAD